MVEFANTASAKGMTAMHQYSWNSFTDIIFKSAELADVQTSRLVVKLHYFIFFCLLNLFCYVHFKVILKDVLT